MFPEAVWLWWSVHAGAARLMGPACQGPLMEFNGRISKVVQVKQTSFKPGPACCLSQRQIGGLSQNRAEERCSHPELGLQIATVTAVEDGACMLCLCIDQKETKRDERSSDPRGA